MNFKQSVIVFVACFTVAVTANLNQHGSDMGLMNFMTRSNDLLRQNPTRSLECFNYYIPLINALAEQYEADYKACLNATKVGRTAAEDATEDERNDLLNRAKASCDLLSKCGDAETVQAMFECYISGGSESARMGYGINADASEELSNLVEQYRVLEYMENKCTNETKRAYEKDSAKAYEDLSRCIAGDSEVPTEAPSTEAPSTENPSTEESSTEEPSTEEPSTEEPSTEEPSTEEPSTEEPSTEEPSTEEPNSEFGDHLLPQEDVSMLRAMKNLKYRLLQN